MGEEKEKEERKLTIFIILSLVIMLVIGSTWELMPRRISQIVIRVTSSGSWFGEYGDDRGTIYVKGEGNNSFTLNRENQEVWMITATFQKSDNGSYELKLAIETPDKEVLSSVSTSELFGIVTVTCALGQTQ